MTATKIPYLKQTETAQQLIVYGRPFLMLAAELQNSSLSSSEVYEHGLADLNFKEKKVVDQDTGALKTARTLGGDETRSGLYAVMPNEEPDYGGFPICVTIPPRTMIAEVKAYSLET